MVNVEDILFLNLYPLLICLRLNFLSLLMDFLSLDCFNFFNLNVFFELQCSVKQIQRCNQKRNQAYKLKNVAENFWKVWQPDAIFSYVE